MAFFAFGEIFDMVAMTLVVGYIFSGLFKKPVGEDYDPLNQFKAGFFSDDFKFAVLVAAPAIILHELGHKFVALSFGLEAVFQAAWFFLMLALLMKLMNFGFIFIVPAYVSIIGMATPLESSLIAFSGPAVNLILWLFAAFAIKKNLFAKRHNVALLLTSRINMFLFIFNMLPIPGFDGNAVFRGLVQAFF